MDNRQVVIIWDGQLMESETEKYQNIMVSS